ncbi:OsmC family protein [Chryseosolibacter indicus]|uniref:OsmC family protein n=1 Tax=Chryseosolibacter indicus TaxID=2782351 RepID=A0ABS5VUI6_9BACT|nr:OsmC family protein [Chryseosolibacter indicus]MBT1703651.1 OsmC family protein [Chryseosolibacter indicus]
MVKIELNRLNDAYHFEALNEQGNKVYMDASPDVGGENLGMRPMQMLLAAMGGCSAIDVIGILKKQKQDLKDIKITVTGEREQDAVPSLYVEVHAHFKLFGNIDKDKANKAVSLSIEKYCSVAKTLEAKAKITYSIEIIPA